MKNVKELFEYIMREHIALAELRDIYRAKLKDAIERDEFISENIEKESFKSKPHFKRKQ